MSVGSCTILAMTTYQKYTWVCTGDCDALIEYTIKDGYGWPAGVMDLTCRCNSNCTLLSVEDATITSTNEREKMEILTPDYTEVIANLENRIKSLEFANGNLNTSVNNYYTKEQQLRTYLMDNYEELEMHTEEIANIFDLSLTKTVEFEATIVVTGSVEIEIGSGIDLDEYITDVLTVDSYNGDVSIFDYSVDNVREA
jgi:hypothetical protein